MFVDISLLASFVALEEDRSFTRAAARLGIRQSALSQRIRKLEQELGFRVVHRTTRRLEISTDGAKLLPVARELICQAKQLECLAAEAGRAAHRALRLGAVPHGASQRHAILRRFRQRHPEIDVQLQICACPKTLEQKVRAGDIDIAFLWNCSSFDVDDHLPCFRAEIGLLVPTSSHMAACDNVSTSDLRDKPIASCQPHMNPDFHDQLERFAGQHDIDVMMATDESVTGVVDFAREKNVPVVACAEFGTSRWPIDGMVYKAWTDSTLTLDVHIARDPFFISPPGQIFWREVKSRRLMA